MVPFMKSSAEINAQKAKSLADDIKKMHFSTPANDDKYNVTYYGAIETVAAAE